MLRLIYDVDLSVDREISLLKLRSQAGDSELIAKKNKRPIIPDSSEEDNDEEDDHKEDHNHNENEVIQNAETTEITQDGDLILNNSENNSELACEKKKKKKKKIDLESVPSSEYTSTSKIKGGGRKFDLISSLEQKYGGGAHYDYGETEGDSNSSNGQKKAHKRNADDEWYDCEDSWIDDSELVEQQQQRDEAVATKTKLDGFFVNTGDLKVEENSKNKNDKKNIKKKEKKKIEPKVVESTHMKQKKQSDWVPTAPVKQLLESLKTDLIPLLSTYTSKRFPLMVDKLLFMTDESIREKEPDIWNDEGYLGYLIQLLNLTSVSKKKMRLHLMRVGKAEQSEEAYGESAEAMDKLKDLIGERCNTSGWPAKYNAWKESNDQNPNSTVKGVSDDTTSQSQKPKKAPAFPWTPEIANAMLTAANKFELKCKKLNALRKANKTAGLSSEDGVQCDEVKYDKSLLLNALSSCWPPELEIPKMSISMKLNSERKKLEATQNTSTTSTTVSTPSTTLPPMSSSSNSSSATTIQQQDEKEVHVTTDLNHSNPIEANTSQSTPTTTPSTSSSSSLSSLSLVPTTSDSSNIMKTNSPTLENIVPSSSSSLDSNQTTIVSNQSPINVSVNGTTSSMKTNPPLPLSFILPKPVMKTTTALSNEKISLLPCQGIEFPNMPFPVPLHSVKVHEEISIPKFDIVDTTKSPSE